MRSTRFGLVPLLLLATSCVAPAFNTSQYEAKVVATAESAVSAIESVRLSLDLMDRHGLPRAPIDVAVSAQEDVLGAVSGSFGLAQPPNDVSLELRQELMGLLDEAQAKLEGARIALRQGDLNEAVATIESAAEVSQKLDDLATRFSDG
jgi:hypothetical protein